MKGTATRRRRVDQSRGGKLKCDGLGDVNRACTRWLAKKGLLTSQPPIFYGKGKKVMTSRPA